MAQERFMTTTVNVIDQAEGENWVSYCGDSAEVLRGIPDASIDLSVYSPPFGALYVYSASERDLGNSASDDQFFQHYEYILRELLRVTKPGRNTAVHVAQVPLQKAKDGVIGLSDFRGDVIRAHQRAGWVFHGEAVIQKDPQAQAIRTHSKALLFVQNRKDSSWSRPALADYILVFRAPGENATPIVPDIDNETWIEWAAPIWRVQTTDDDKAMAVGDVFDLAPGTPLLWFGIEEGDTLNRRRRDGYAGLDEAREADDNRHICPLQLGTIERCVRLWSNRGETVLSPFGGIGSEGYVAVKHGRRAVLCELKPAYWRCGVQNLRRIEDELRVPDLFSQAGILL
jgi:DNA modification methylase